MQSPVDKESLGYERVESLMAHPYYVPSVRSSRRQSGQSSGLVYQGSHSSRIRDNDIFLTGPAFLRTKEEDWSVKFTFCIDKFEEEVVQKSCLWLYQLHPPRCCWYFVSKMQFLGTCCPYGCMVTTPGTLKMAS